MSHTGVPDEPHAVHALVLQRGEKTLHRGTRSDKSAQGRPGARVPAYLPTSSAALPAALPAGRPRNSSGVASLLGTLVLVNCGQIGAAVTGAALALFVQAADDCAHADLVAPAERIVPESRPTLVWRPLPGVSRYRLRLQSRVPEGEIRVALDTLVDGTQFTPPRPLADHRAIVKVLVTPLCDSQPALDNGARFFIDTGLSCRMPPLAFDAGARTWSWQPATGALGYEVYRYAMPDGKLLGREETPQPLSFSIDGHLAVAVRARCENGYSDWQFAP